MSDVFELGKVRVIEAMSLLFELQGENRGEMSEEFEI